MKFKIWNDTGASVPTVYVHTFVGDGSDIWEACHRAKCPPFNLVANYGSNLDDALTPWPAEGVRKGQAPFQGKAEAHLNEVLNQIVPEVEQSLPSPSSYLAMAGYSLAGLFTLWTAWKTTRFKRLACVSSSFWYPDFCDFIRKQPMLNHPECIYFSLGNQEAKTRHPLMKEVEHCTLNVLEYIKEQHIATTYEVNQGNHFTEPAVRTAKAIHWMLNQ